MRPRMLRLLLLPISFIFSTEALSDTVLCKYRNNIVHEPFKNQLNNDSEIYFSDSKVPNEPIYLITSKMKFGKCEKETIIDRYYIAGSPPSVETLFFHNIHNKKNAITIISWEINSRGIGTYGKLYQIFAYKKTKSGLIANKEIELNPNMSGLDGYQEGEQTYFKLKTAGDIKKYLDQHLNQPIEPPTQENF